MAAQQALTSDATRGRRPLRSGWAECKSSGAKGPTRKTWCSASKRASEILAEEASSGASAAPSAAERSPAQQQPAADNTEDADAESAGDDEMPPLTNFRTWQATPSSCSSHAGAFSDVYATEEWSKGIGSYALSGIGSRQDTTLEFCQFFESFLLGNRITSVVDAGCGHWPSGYQRFLDWCGVSYTGIDVVTQVLEENRTYFSKTSRLAAHGLSRAQFLQGDVCGPLPAADLLLVKDVLMHLPNAAILDFLAHNIQTCRHRHVMIVQNEAPVSLRTVIDIKPGQLLPFDVREPPFCAPFVNVFRWMSDEPKVVQLLEDATAAAEPSGCEALERTAVPPRWEHLLNSRRL
mmetsp:Transcript_36960/g.68198  ORF Transcript_36960/g.68198 Transcript_36960/m.68198 type:complete len:349 (+) Transcript_36960:42-1088(+)